MFPGNVPIFSRTCALCLLIALPLQATAEPPGDTPCMRDLNTGRCFEPPADPAKAVCLRDDLPPPPCSTPLSTAEWSALLAQTGGPTTVLPFGYPRYVDMGPAGRFCDAAGAELTRPQLNALLDGYPPSAEEMARWRAFNDAEVAFAMAAASGGWRTAGTFGGMVPLVEGGDAAWSEALCTFNRRHAQEREERGVEARAAPLRAAAATSPPLSAWVLSADVYRHLGRPLPADDAEWTADVEALYRALRLGIALDALQDAIDVVRAGSPDQTLTALINAALNAPAPTLMFEDPDE